MGFAPVVPYELTSAEVEIVRALRFRIQNIGQISGFMQIAICWAQYVLWIGFFESVLSDVFSFVSETPSSEYGR